MRRIETYLFRQFLIPSLVATAALGAVALLGSTLTKLDLVVDDRQTAWIFIQIVLLSVPQLLIMVIPVGLFVASLVALNRLHTEQEIVVCFAGGMSRWQVISPLMRLATFACLIMLALNLWGSPASYRAVRQQLFRIRTDLAASLVREGQFTQPAPGLTVYAQSVDQAGMLRNLFIEQQRANGATSTFTAKSGLITKRNGQPVLVMRDGSNQQFSASGVLNYLAFDEYVFDLSPYLNTSDTVQYKVSDWYLHELLFPNPYDPPSKKDRRKMLAEANNRLSAPLYAFTFVCLALWAVIGGPFSRLGYGRRIATAAALAIVLRVGGFAVQAASESAFWFNVLQYALPLAPVWILLKRLLRPSIGLGRENEQLTLTPLAAGA